MIRIRIRLSALLGERRMKQKELADLTGICAATINHYYNEGIDRISLTHFEMICEVLEVNLSELLVMEIIDNDIPTGIDYRWERETRRKKQKKKRGK